MKKMGDTAVKYAGLFARQADAYAKYRPTYPPVLFEAIDKYVAAHGTGSRELAADIACGSGQASLDLAKRYARVIGVDASAEQVAKAPPAANVEFHHGSAEKTNLPPNSMDLLAVAQAFHWFDQPAFYEEAARVLKPGGTLAIWCYSAGCPTGLAANPEVDARASAAFMRVYSDILGPHWDAKRWLVDAGYEGLEPKEGADSPFCHVERHSLAMSRDMPVAGLANYVTTWSSYTSYMHDTKTARGTDADPAAWLRKELSQTFVRSVGASTDGKPAAIAGTATDPAADDDTPVLRMTWPVTLILATRKA
jgi:SAM-dependent methyltransferase